MRLKLTSLIDDFDVVVNTTSLQTYTNEIMIFKRNHTNLINELYEEAPLLGVRSHSGTNALMLAIAVGDVRKATAMIDKGVDVTSTNAVGLSPLHFCSMSNDISNLKLLERRGCNLDGIDRRGRSALIIATEMRFHSIMTSLLQNGASANIQAANGYTAAMVAIMNADAHGLRILIDNGADLSIKDSYGTSTWTMLKQLEVSTPSREVWSSFIRKMQ